MIIAVNEAREVLGLPSLVLYTEEQLEPSSVGQWEIDEVVPQSKGRGAKAIAGVLRFTGGETVFAPLRAEGIPCVRLADKAVVPLPVSSGTASLPAVSARGFPLRGRGRDMTSIEDRPDDASTRVPEGGNDPQCGEAGFYPLASGRLACGEGYVAWSSRAWQ